MDEEERIKRFVAVYTAFGDVGEAFEKMTRKMNAADVLLGLGHEDFYETMKEVRRLSSAIRIELANIEVSIPGILNREEDD